MSDESDFGTGLATHGGWIATAVMGVWGWILRVALARHLEALGKLEERLRHLEISVGKIKGKLGIENGDE